MDNANQKQEKKPLDQIPTRSTGTLSIRVRNPERTIYENEIKAFSGFNEQGPFDILEAHGNFISIIKNKIIIYEKTGKKNEFPVDTGVLKVYGDKINIFLGLQNPEKP